MAYHEKHFQTEFNKWCKHFIRTTSVFELKISKGKSLPFNAVKEHQVHALSMARHKHLVYKIPDDSLGQKPFDSFCIVESQAYVVIMFRAKNREFVMIDIDDWLEEQTKSTRKSITEERAKEIGMVCRLN